MGLRDITIGSFLDAGAAPRGFVALMRAKSAETYEEFVEAVYDAIEAATDRMQESSYIKKDRSEDDLTTEIIDALFHMGFDASHDTMVNGHTDLVVRLEAKGYLWLGEAKKHSDYNWLHKGYQQLLTRYSLGTRRQSHGALIIYSSVTLQKVMSEWKARLQTACPSATFDLCPRDDNAFVMKVPHPKTGVTYTIRHIPISLQFEPLDR